MSTPRGTLTCPKGHSDSFTSFGLVYECHNCNRRFYRPNGVPTWTEPREGDVPVPEPQREPCCENCLWDECAGKAGGCGCKCHKPTEPQREQGMEQRAPKCPYCKEPMTSGDGSYWCMNKRCTEQFYPSGNDEPVASPSQAIPEAEMQLQKIAEAWSQREINFELNVATISFEAAEVLDSILRAAKYGRKP